MTYAAKTLISPERTRGEIERLIANRGARAFMYSTEPEKSFVQFVLHDRLVRFRLPMPPVDDFKFHLNGKGEPDRWRPRTQKQKTEMHAQAIRSRWRALFLAIKSKLESVETGIETFEQAFLANIVASDGRLIGEVMRPQIAAMYSTGKGRLLLEAPQ